MSIKAGLVGLPNVGKSTLFNALTKSSIPAENYPFCTIDPHIAITNVPDDRLEKLQKIYGSGKIIPATVTFVDIAGLVKGAASGEGLGNQFLSNIREVDLILHVLRCFEDDNITHTSGEVDPVVDYEIIIDELILKDIESISKRLERLERDRKKLIHNPPLLKPVDEEIALLQQLKTALGNQDTQKAREITLQSKTTTIPLLTTKNFLIIANISETELEDDAYKNSPHYQALVKKFGKNRVIPVSARTEYELSQTPQEDVPELMGFIGMHERGLDAIIEHTYDNLGLITFFTCGPKEVHAWPIKKGTSVRTAAGEIHSDLERGFICAEVFNCQDLFTAGSELALKEKGAIRREGQDYIVRDGDLLNIKFSV